VEAAGIAPAAQNSEADSQDSTCVDAPPPCLHIACADFGLRELVACWHRMTVDVRERIMRIARGQEDSSRFGE
jgi:hypothetical protein